MINSVLTIHDLAFRYSAGGSESFELAMPSLQLAAGEQMLLTGGSGSGKSTLLLLIAGLMEPSRGRVLIAGKSIHELRGASRDRYRGRHVGMIFQTLNLLHGFTAAQNVMAAMMFTDIAKSQQRPRSVELLNHLGIRETDREVDRMSLGQQQRVAVARAVACDPVLVLADEPTASLDPENAAGAMNLIQNACREKNAALLCVSHDPSMAARFARRASLRELAAASA